RAFFAAVDGIIERDFDAGRARFVGFGEQHRHAVMTGLAHEPAAAEGVRGGGASEQARTDTDGGELAAFRDAAKRRSGPHQAAVAGDVVALSCGSSLSWTRAWAAGPGAALAELGEHVLSLSISDDAAWVAAVTAKHVHLVRLADRRVVARFDALSGG